MKRISSWVLAGTGILLAGLAVDMAWAQGGAHPATASGVPALAPDKKTLSIRRMPKLGKVKQPTPLYNTSATRSSPGRPHEWAVFEVIYDTSPEWLDEVVVTYYLMAERRSDKKEFTYYQTTVRYTDIARGEHIACVVLPPSTLLRNGDQFIGLAVEFTSADGALLAVNSEVSGTMLPSEWWKKPEVTESTRVVKRDGLVDRAQTPFGLINIDDYEAVK